MSPYCDCHAENDVPVVPDVGMFASFDPVALDLACTEAVLAQKPMAGSVLNRLPDGGRITFNPFSPLPTGAARSPHAKKIGLGEDSYQLVQI